MLLLPCPSSFRPVTGFIATRTRHHVHRVNLHRRFSTMASNDHVLQTTTITLSSGEAVELTAAPGLSAVDLRNAIDSSLFQEWLKNIQSECGLLAQGQMSLKKVYIQGVDMFGSGVGFLKFKADVLENETGKKVPGIVFARGQSVAVLILLESSGEVYTVLTEQVEEEIGISLSLTDMVNLTSFLDPSTGSKMFPSPGGCDEEISLFLYRGTARQEIIDDLQGKEMGLREHGELIKVRVVPYDKLWHVTADAKALASIALYEMAKREGLLPQVNTSPDTSA